MVRGLARREHSRVELNRKLTNRFPNLKSSERRELIDRLQSQNLQSDERFCEMLIRSRLNKGHGYRRIERELAMHEIAPGCFKQYLSEAEASEKDRAIAALEKWTRCKKDPSRIQALRFLTGRGFSFSDATEAVDVIFR